MADIPFTGNAGDFLKIGVAAAGRGDVDAVRAILKVRPKWIHQLGSHGRTMLWEASHRGKLPMVKYLVRRGADIDACGTHFTPYFVDVSCYCIARFKKREAVADFLLSKGARLDIHTAAFLGDLAGVKRFLRKSRRLLHEGHPQSQMADKDAGVNFYMAPAPWATPLVYALRGGDEATVRYLIERGGQIQGNERALFQAADERPALVQLLLEHGADPRCAPEVHVDAGPLFDVVSAWGAEKPSKDQLSEELVYLCRGDRGGNPEKVQRLLRLGARVNHRDAKGKTALHRAAKAGFVDVMQLLLAAGAKVDVADQHGETALFEVARSTIRRAERKKAALRLLLDAGADRAHRNGKGQDWVDVIRRSRQPDVQALVRIMKRA